ncbi:MAG: sigma 54-interacting transcriptional regulator [Planctomycetota bacterium]
MTEDLPKLCSPYLLHVFQDGEKTTHRFSKTQVTIGRSRSRDVPLSERSISRLHVTLLRSGDGFLVHDEGSQNGTYIGGDLIEPESTVELKPGEQLRIGPYEIIAELMQGSTEDGSQATEETQHTEGPLNMGTFARLIQALNEELDQDRLLALVVDAAIRTTEAERGFLILEKDGELSIPVARDFVGEMIEDPSSSKMSHTIVEEVLASGESRLTVNAQTDERFKSFKSVEDLRLRSVLCVPLRILGHIEGALYLDNRLQQHAFTEEDQSLLVVLSDISGVAIRNARLVSDLRLKNQALVTAHDRVAELNARLEGKVKKQVEELKEVREELAASRKALGLRHEYRKIVGESEPMKEIFRLLDRYVDSPDPVLIQGESGTGKELIARAIHEQGERKDGPFVSENCAALPESLLESELFGYERGAFTGATRNHKGLFEQAKNGTLFLDEIGDMSSDLQSKLLRVLQEKEIRPLGSTRTVSIDVRLVTATHHDLTHLIKEGRFREDLFYRLHVLPIVLPSLRQRKSDIPLLMMHFLRKACVEAHRAEPRVDPRAMDLLSAYHWPGNIRELENEIRRALLIAEGVLLPEHLSEHIQNPALTRDETSPLPAESGTTLTQIVRQLEETEIRRALGRSQNNKSKASELLGISRFALQRKLEKYGLG